MKIGLATFPTEYAMSIVELGRAAEDLGFESLFVPEHTHPGQPPHALPRRH